MNNEEMKAKYDAINSMEDAYALMQENGYKGTMEDFEALCAKAADGDAMDLDAMDAVAGGFGTEDIKDGIVTAYNVTVDALKTAWETTSGAVSKGWNWVKENPAMAAEIGGSVVVTALGITAGVKYARRSNTTPTNPVNPVNPVPNPVSNQDVQDFLNTTSDSISSSFYQ